MSKRLKDLLGEVVTVPVLQYTPVGAPVLRFVIKRRGVFVNLVAWGGLALSVSELGLTVGDQVVVGVDRFDNDGVYVATVRELSTVNVKPVEERLDVWLREQVFAVAF